MLTKLSKKPRHSGKTSTESIENFHKWNKIFTDEFFAKHFSDQYPNSQYYPKNGYPDTGSGKFSEKISFQDWIEFNNAQRIHMNYLEGLTLIILLELVLGLVYPRLTIALGIVYLIGREVYAIGYSAKGPQGRIFGAIIFDVVLLILFPLTLYTTYSIGGGIGGLTSVFLSS